MVADVVVRGNDVAAQESDAELNEAGPIGFRAMGDGADDRAVVLAELVENVGNAVLSGYGEVLFAA